MKGVGGQSVEGDWGLTAAMSCLELPVPEPEEQSRPRKPTLQPVLQLKARRRLDKVSTARSKNPDLV